MKNIGKDLQNFLGDHFTLDKIVLKDQQISNDKTIKSAFSIDEKSVVEGVLIPTKKRMTATARNLQGR